MDSADYGRKLAQTFHLSKDDCIKAMRRADEIADSQIDCY